jgi:hypothetical protein
MNSRRAVGLTPLLRPERLYFWFGEPIGTTCFEGRHEDEASPAPFVTRYGRPSREGSSSFSTSSSATRVRVLPGRCHGDSFSTRGQASLIY